jgi:hypothetical protein
MVILTYDEAQEPNRHAMMPRLRRMEVNPWIPWGEPRRMVDPETIYLLPWAADPDGYITRVVVSTEGNTMQYPDPEDYYAYRSVEGATTRLESLYEPVTHTRTEEENLVWPDTDEYRVEDPFIHEAKNQEGEPWIAGLQDFEPPLGCCKTCFEKLPFNDNSYRGSCCNNALICRPCYIYLIKHPAEPGQPGIKCPSCRKIKKKWYAVPPGWLEINERYCKKYAMEYYEKGKREGAASITSIDTTGLTLPIKSSGTAPESVTESDAALAGLIPEPTTTVGTKTTAHALATVINSDPTLAVPGSRMSVKVKGQCKQMRMIEVGRG